MVFCYVLLRWLLKLVTLRRQSDAFKDLEIIVLRHELAILQQVVKLEGRARVRNWLRVNAVTQTAPLLRRIVSCAGADERFNTERT